MHVILSDCFCLSADLVRVNENLYDHGAKSDKLARFMVLVDKVLKSLQEPDKVLSTVKKLATSCHISLKNVRGFSFHFMKMYSMYKIIFMHVK